MGVGFWNTVRLWSQGCWESELLGAEKHKKPVRCPGRSCAPSTQLAPAIGRGGGWVDFRTGLGCLPCLKFRATYICLYPVQQCANISANISTRGHRVSSARHFGPKTRSGSAGRRVRQFLSVLPNATLPAASGPASQAFTQRILCHPLQETKPASLWHSAVFPLPSAIELWLHVTI